jgi:hypothetical protein
MKIIRVKRIIVTITGIIVLIIGIFLIVLPGPAIIVIPIGLLILGTEYEWAKKLVNNIRERI